MVLIIGAQMFIPVHVNFCLLSDEIQRKKVPDQQLVSHVIWFRYFKTI